MDGFFGWLGGVKQWDRRRVVLFFALATAFLIYGGLQHSLWLCALSLGIYAIAALLWNLTAQPISPPTATVVLISALLISGGTNLVFGSLQFDLDGLGLVGGIAVSLGIGWLITSWRESLRFQHVRGALVIFAAATLIVWGLSLLTPGIPSNSLVMIVAGVLLLPIGVAVASEDALRVLDSREGLRVWLLASGALVFLTCLTVLAAMSGPRRLVLVVGAAVLIVVGCVVSSTQSDVVLIVAVLALMYFMLPDQVPLGSQHRPLPGQDTLVALGDSYMSGEGAKAFFEGTDDDGSNECRRAPTAYAAEAVGPDKPFPHLTFLACSGARARHIYAVAQQPDEPPGTEQEGGMDQLEHLASVLPATSSVRLAIVSIGGNDSGFSTIGLTCLTIGECGEIEELLLGNLEHVGKEVHDAFERIREALGPEVPVVVVPYPVPVAPRACGETWLSADEHRFLHNFTMQLNDTLQREADEADFWFLDEMETSLEERQLRLCDDNPGGKAGVNFIGIQTVGGRTEQEFNPSNWAHNSLHPNELGHDAMGAVFAGWLQEHPDLAAVPDSGAAESMADEVVPADATQPPCALTDTEETGCVAIARDWAIDQTVSALRLGGLVPAAGLLGAWLFWLGVIARYRARNQVAAPDSAEPVA